MLCVSYNILKCRYIIKDIHRHTMNYGRRIIRDVIHIIIISSLINEIIENSHIEGMNKIFNIMSDNLTISERLHPDSVWSLN